MSPATVAAGRYAAALLMGMALGFVYGFLRPLRRKLTSLADLLFSLLLGAGWVYLAFGICRGDLRLSHLAALGLGILFWEKTAGRGLRRMFLGFWTGIFRILGLFTAPFRKICKKIRVFLKKRFASEKKSATIE